MILHRFMYDRFQAFCIIINMNHFLYWQKHSCISPIYIIKGMAKITVTLIFILKKFLVNINEINKFHSFLLLVTRKQPLSRPVTF